MVYGLFRLEITGRHRRVCRDGGAWCSAVCHACDQRLDFCYDTGKAGCMLSGFVNRGQTYWRATGIRVAVETDPVSISVEPADDQTRKRRTRIPIRQEPVMPTPDSLKECSWLRHIDWPSYQDPSTWVRIGSLGRSFSSRETMPTSRSIATAPI